MYSYKRIILYILKSSIILMSLFTNTLLCLNLASLIVKLKYLGLSLAHLLNKETWSELAGFIYNPSLLESSYELSQYVSFFHNHGPMVSQLVSSLFFSLLCLA